MKHSYLLTGIRTKNLLSMVFRNKGLSVRYLHRFLFLLNSGIWSDFFYRREKILIKKAGVIRKTSAPPVFIIGHWRTGSTFLHQLLSVDKNFTTPNVYQVSIPDSMLTSEKYYYPIMSRALGKTRPMDNVKIGFHEPMEDEYALLKLCKNTPLENLIFPKSEDFFLTAHNNFVPSDREGFKEAFLAFYNKLTNISGQQLLFKNPFHSMRLNVLLEIFPDAKFIHIYRHPEKVVPSAIRMWDIVGRQNALKRGWKTPKPTEVAEVYKKILLEVRKVAVQLPKNQFIEVKYEELEKTPADTIKALYDNLGIAYSESYDQNLNAYLDALRGFQKNNYITQKKDIDAIKLIMQDVLPEYYIMQ